jgi:fumarate reductase subunit D
LALPPNLRGILWVALSGLVFALLNVFTLIPAQHLNPYVMAFLRYSFGAMFLLPIMARLGLYRSLHTNRLGLHISRGALHTVGIVLWFVASPARSSSPSGLRSSWPRTCACGGGSPCSWASPGP